jgi:hypothetical protein
METTIGYELWIIIKMWSKSPCYQTVLKLGNFAIYILPELSSGNKKYLSEKGNVTQSLTPSPL